MTDAADSHKCSCGLEDQHPQVPIHISHIDCSNKDNTIDAWPFGREPLGGSWHVTGHRSYHSDDKSAQFIKICKERLVQRQLPIKIGWTGYINSDAILSEEANGWCLDTEDRMVVIFNGMLIFQRYKEGDILMRSIDGYTYGEFRGADMDDMIAKM